MEIFIPPLAAEVITTIAGIPITNSFINSFLVMIFFVILGFFVKSQLDSYNHLKTTPTKLVNFLEMIIETLLTYFDNVTGNRAKTLRFLPIVGSLFLFILVSNWVGLLPGIGSIGVWGMHEGHMTIIPFFRPANTDLNMTLAMALFSVLASHLIGIVTLGFLKHANKYIKLGDLYNAFRSRSPVKILTAFVELGVGFIEIFSEIAKVASLSLRLFGNIFAGEVLLTVLLQIMAFFAPLPFMALELLVGLVQAAVFSMLTLVYLSMSADEPHGSHEEHKESHTTELAKSS